MAFIDTIMAASKRRYSTSQNPIFGEVRIQSLTRAEIRSLRDSFTDDDGRINARGNRANELLVASCVVNDEGTRQISDDDVMRGVFDGVDDAGFVALYATCRDHVNWLQDPTWKDVTAAAKN